MNTVKTTCTECGTPLWGIELHQRGDKFYCSADFERLSVTEARKNKEKERQYADYKKMFSGNDNK